MRTSRRNHQFASSLSLLLALAVAVFVTSTTQSHAAWTKFSKQCKNNTADEIDLTFTPDSGKGKTPTGVSILPQLKSKEGSNSYGGKLGYVDLKHSQDTDVEWLTTYADYWQPAFNATSEDSYTNIKVTGADECGMPVKTGDFEWRSCQNCDEVSCIQQELVKKCESDLKKEDYSITLWKYPITAIPLVTKFSPESDMLYAAVLKNLIHVRDPWTGYNGFDGKSGVPIPWESEPHPDAVKYAWHVWKLKDKDGTPVPGGDDNYESSCTNLWAVTSDWTFTINWEYGTAGCDDEGRWAAEVYIYDDCGNRAFANVGLIVDKEHGAHIGETGGF